MSTRCASSCFAPSIILAAAAAVTGCGNLSTAENAAVISGAVAGAAVVAGRTPSHEVQQIYYLGVFDPRDQLPPTVYRVRVHGQASFISNTQFASGWVPANVIDALGVGVSFDGGRVNIEKSEDDFTSFQTGRRLMMFGPEGFREAPEGHRLVIVMGSDPSVFFRAVDESLGVVALATQEQGSTYLNDGLFRTLVKTRAIEDRLKDFVAETRADIPEAGVVE